MWAGSCVGSLFGNLVDSVGNWVDETEQDISVKMIVVVAHLLCLYYSIWRLKVVNLKMDHF